MAKQTSAHPYLVICAASLAPYMAHGPSHDRDPPPIDNLLPLEPRQPAARELLDLLLGADHDLRDDHTRAAAINLDLAETRLRLAINRDGPKPALEAALAGVQRAREELARGQTARACAAVTDAARAVARTN